VLHFILGRAGTGKTTLLLERLREAAQRGERCVLLVPEQYSFEAERQVSRQLGPQLALRVEVLSFTRLCNSVFRAHGGLAGVPVTQTGRYLLMSLAVAELAEHLKVYRKSCNNPAFLETLTSACSEFKAAGLTPKALDQVAQSVESGQLRDKLSDLTALYTAYQALLERGYTDPEDDLLRAREMMAQNSIFEGACLFVDGFTTFMAGEFALLHLLIARCREVHVAFPADGLQDTEKGLGTFSASKQAISRLMRYARQAGVVVASPTVLTEPLRYQSPELAFLSRRFLLPGEEVYPVPPEHLTICSAPDLYREIEYVAACIDALVREEGYRYKEIAVVARETGPYLRALERVFLRRNIPYFVDTVRDVETMPLAGGLVHALEAVRSNFDSAAVLCWAKSPLMGLDPRAVAQLENYSYLWSVRGKLWTGELRNNPRGMAGPLTEEDLQELTEINQTREQVMTPLLHLRDALRSCDGRGFAAAVYRLLEEVDAPGKMTAFAQTLPQGERETFLSESGQLWDLLMETLDVFGEVLGTTVLPAHRFCELLRLSLTCAEIGLVPQTLDQVLVGKADRIRPGEVKAVFVIGAVEGQFPAALTSGGVFTDEERRTMIRLGAEIGAPSLERAVLERYFCYHALTLASHRLWVSYPRDTLKGEGKTPSVIVTQLQELFPLLEEAEPDLFALVGGAPSAFDLLAAHYREDTPKTAALLAYFSKSRGSVLRRMQVAAYKPSHRLADRSMAEKLFGKRMRLSPSQVERYHRCAFAYFARDGLKIKPRRRVQFDPLESGSLVHHVLQVMVQQHKEKLFTLSKSQMEAQVREIIDGYLAERIMQQEALPRRFSDLFRRLTASITRLLCHLGEELAQSQYRPVAFELPISTREGVAPLELVTADGTTVLVEGVVDRVDVMERGENRYIRVVDYKSGGKEFRLDDVLYGLNLQMLLYLFTIAENGKGMFENAIPAGVLYLPVHAQYFNSARNEKEEKAAADLKRQWKMSGLLLEDEISLRGMEQELKGVFIPAKITAGGTLDKRSALAGKAAMGRLSRKVKELIAEMAESLSRGGISSCPVSSRGHNPCDYCDYATLCGFEPGDEALTVEPMNLEEALAALEKEDGKPSPLSGQASAVPTQS
jgi:ATP-dependent helicase/nuclease subunit B